MFGYRKIVLYLIVWVSVVTLAGCGGSTSVVSIGPYQVELPGTYTKEYTTTADLSYTHMDGDEVRGTMIVQVTEKPRTEDQMDDFIEKGSYPAYEIEQVRTTTSDCEINYRRYHVQFIGDPIHDTMMYLSYVFISESTTTIISYLTPSTKDRTKRDNAREETIGCTP